MGKHEPSAPKAPGAIPRSRSGRVPGWVIDEALGLPQKPTPWRAGHDNDVPTPPTRRRRVARFVLTTCVLGLLGTAYWVLFTPKGVTQRAPGSAASANLWPTPGHEAKRRPRGKPPVVTLMNDSYRFLNHQANGNIAVAYDPCRPIHYVVRPDGAPQGGAALISDAVARVSAATGLKFIADGTTSEAPSRERKPFQPDRYGDRWAPILIAWVTTAENPDFAASVAGEAGSHPVARSDGPRAYVTGQMQLDATKIGKLVRMAEGNRMARALVLHEFGHLVGLDHVADNKQLMYATTGSEVVDFGPGDLTGLAELGRGPCIPDL